MQRLNLNLSIKMVQNMKDKVYNRMRDFLEEACSIYIDDIRGTNTSAFTRLRKVSPDMLLLQMLSQKGITQSMELNDFYDAIDKDMDISVPGFFKARMKFNPEAIRLMSNDFITEIYDEEYDSLVKLNGYLIASIDGSDIILPSTSENMKIYGAAKNAGDINNSPVMGKLSIMYDCINGLVIDTQINRYKYDERKMASVHLGVAKANIMHPIVVVFDRGYFSIRLVCQLIDNNQKFLFRMAKDHLKRYTSALESGDDRWFDVEFDRVLTNDYRDDRRFRARLMSETFHIRMAKIDIGSESEEILLTNLSEEEFDTEALKQLYHLRWANETAYNTLKNKMKLEEFSGYRSTIIRQDIYSSVWLYNYIQLTVIEASEKHEIPEDRYKYKMKFNQNFAIGLVKKHFLSSIISEDRKAGLECFDKVEKEISTHLVPIRPERSYERKTNTKNKSRMSYRYSY